MKNLTNTKQDNWKGNSCDALPHYELIFPYLENNRVIKTWSSPLGVKRGYISVCVVFMPVIYFYKHWFKSSDIAWELEFYFHRLRFFKPIFSRKTLIGLVFILLLMFILSTSRHLKKTQEVFLKWPTRTLGKSNYIIYMLILMFSSII